MNLPRIVSAAEWQAARDALLVREKEETRRRDALAAERRRLPMVRIEQAYTFRGPDGERSLVDLFEDRPQLLLYHFMFAPGVQGWPDAGCPGCSMVADNADHHGVRTHLRQRGASFVMISRAPLENIETYRKRMGWSLPWLSSDGTDFNADFGRSPPEGEAFGLSVFLRDGTDVYRTWFTDGRGVEALGSVWSFLDLLPLGRQEEQEDTPEGRPQTPPYQWWRRHDEY